MPRLSICLLLAFGVLVPACNASQSAGQPPAATAASAAAATTVIEGTVKAPPAIVGSVLPTGGGHVLPTGGGHVLPTGGGHYRLQALTQAPLAGATVYLADAGGNRYPLVDAVTSDEQGHYRFPAVPVDLTVMVVVQAHDSQRDQDVALQTLAHPTALGATADVDTASSLVTLAVVQGESSLGGFNPGTFQGALDQVAAHLGDDDVPDLGDQAAMLARVQALEGSLAELKGAITAMRQELTDLEASVARIEQQLGKPGGRGTPPPTAPPPPPTGRPTAPPPPPTGSPPRH